MHKRNGLGYGTVHLLPRPLKAMAHRYRHTVKKPTFFQDHQNSNCLMTQKVRSSEVQHRSGSQDKNTADSQKQKKLSFKPYLLIMMIETLSGIILSRNFHLTLSTQRNQILPLFLIIYFQKEGRKSQKTFLHLQKMYLHLHHLHLHLHPHWRQSKNDHTLQEQGSQHARTLGSQPEHIVTLTYRHYLHLD